MSLIKKYDLLFVGGHHNSAVPLIKKFKEDGYKLKFIGHKFASKSNKNPSSEYKEISLLGIDYINLDAAKFYRVAGVKKYFIFLKSFLFCLKYLFFNRPKIIVSYGGYLAVPVILAGKLLNIKSVTHEQTTSFGLANKVLSKLVNKIYLTWDIKGKPKNSEVVGLPLRKEILSVKPKNLSSDYQLKTLFVQGGKQGSHKLNSFIFENISSLLEKFTIFHQTSKHSDFDDFAKGQEFSKKYKNYSAFDYLYGEDYTNILEKSDFMLTRSGAHITYEVCYLKIPAIFVPISWSSRNEQRYNAKKSKEYIPSVILEESNLSIESFFDSLKNLKEGIAEDKRYNTVVKNSTEKMYSSIKRDFLSSNP